MYVHTYELKAPEKKDRVNFVNIRILRCQLHRSELIRIRQTTY